MSLRRAHFRQADVTRALKGAMAAGVGIEKIEIDLAGRIVVIPRRNDGREISGTSWDDLLASSLTSPSNDERGR